MRDPKVLLNLVRRSVSYFSEKSLSTRFGYSKEEIEAIYEYALDNDLVEHITVIECPSCANKEESKDSKKLVKCSRCNTEFHLNDEKVDIYTYTKFK